MPTGAYMVHTLWAANPLPWGKALVWVKMPSEAKKRVKRSECCQYQSEGESKHLIVLLCYALTVMIHHSVLDEVV